MLQQEYVSVPEQQIAAAEVEAEGQAPDNYNR